MQQYENDTTKFSNETFMALSGEVKSQPEYELLRTAFAEKKAPFVIVAGSGLSSPAGLPTWPALRTYLETEATKKVASLNQIGDSILSPKLSSAISQKDPWVAFALLKEILSKPTFEALIEQQLSPDISIDAPAGYDLLLKLRPRGFVTLNLDRFSQDAMNKAYPSTPIAPIYGKELSQKWGLLKASKAFLVYLHGALHDPATWIFTQSDLSEIQGSEGHSVFLNNLFIDNLVLFVGVSADDIALSKRLVSLTQGGFRPKNLYWLTTRLDEETSAWADDSYIKLIRYTARDNDAHTDTINDIVEDLLSFVPKEPELPPLRTPIAGLSSEVSLDFDDPDLLAQKDPESIRNSITILLNSALDNNKENDVYSTYRAFCEKYDYPVHRAFYKHSRPEHSLWFGYKLNFPPLGRGNFGEVFSAMTKDGDMVAVKIMHESIFGNNDMLGGFRRGVRSMEIVTLQDISGMVPIIDRFELPPTIIMPYIEGQPLQDVLETRPDLPWVMKLGILLKIGRIVSRGHALAETILHRDIKPSNIMISNFEYQGFFDPEVVVLDFDMSWHKGSKEKDVVFESRDDFGYLAPEQTTAYTKYSARSTRVDSYGIGMTSFFVFGVEHPRPNEAFSERWLERVLRATSRGYEEKWKSGPFRMARLIARATVIDQIERVDFATYVRELEDIHTAVTSPLSLENVELWAEELISHIGVVARYSWDDSVGAGKISTPTGIEIDVACDFRANSVVLTCRYTDRGVREKGSLLKYLGVAIQNAEKKLKDAGWEIVGRSVGNNESLIKAQCRLARFKRSAVDLMKAADSAVSEFAF